MAQAAFVYCVPEISHTGPESAGAARWAVMIVVSEYITCARALCSTINVFSSLCRICGAMRIIFTAAVFFKTILCIGILVYSCGSSRQLRSYGGADAQDFSQHVGGGGL